MSSDVNPAAVSALAEARVSPVASKDDHSHVGFGMTDAGLVLMAAIWGINFTVVKVGLETLPPLAFNGLRMALAAVVLAVISFAVAGVRTFPSRRDALMLLAMGIVGNGFYQLAFISGLARTRAGIAALVIAAGPAWIALFSQLAGRERVTLRGWSGIGLQLVGMLCVVASAGLIETDRDVLLGAGLVMLGSMIWAVFTVMLQPYTRRVNPLHLASLTLSSGAVLLFVLALPSLRALELREISIAAWVSVLYAGLGAMVIAYLLYYRGVRVLGPTRTAMYSNLQPLIALLVAWGVLHERPTMWQGIGGGLLMIGLLWSRTTRMQPAGPAPLAAASDARSA